MDKEFIWNLPAPMQAFMAVSKYMDDHGITAPLADIVGQAIFAWIAAEEGKREAATANRLNAMSCPLRPPASSMQHMVAAETPGPAFGSAILAIQNGCLPAACVQQQKAAANLRKKKQV